MTYTADDFRRASFARRSPDEYCSTLAVRDRDDPETPWRGKYGAWSDEQMTRSGFEPVQECGHTLATPQAVEDARARVVKNLRKRAEKAEKEHARLSAMHAQQMKTIAELQRELGLTRPDWVDAPAVLARRESRMDAQPQVWANVGRDVWESGTLRAHTEHLRGVTPLYPEETR